MWAGSPLPLTITIECHYKHDKFVRKKTMSGLTVLECPHPGVEHIHTISVPLNRAISVLCMLYMSLVHLLLYYVLPVHVVRWCTVPVAVLVDDAAEILE